MRIALPGLLGLALAMPALAEAPGDWASNNRDFGAQRYVPLRQITPANVATLRQAWVYHMKPAASADKPAPARLFISEAIPIVVANTMYLPTPYGRIVALDASTGVEKWSAILPNNDVASIRGVSWWAGDGTRPPAIIVGTRAGRMLSYDARTGALNAWFGTDGVVELKTPEVMNGQPNAAYIQPSPPFVWRNLIFTGAGPGEGPGGSNGGKGPAGDTRAWDARTGKLVWTFHSVPRPGELGHETWGGDSWRDRSGVNVWGWMTVDDARGILYMPYGAPNNDRVGIDRPGNNLFSSSIVAVNAATGKYLWHFQVVHHDVWDMDTQSPPTLVDVKRDGRTIPALVSVNKNSLMFVLDRVTGKPVFGVEERPVPPSTIPGEQLSPTQPFPVLPEPLAQTELSRANLYKGEAAHEAYCAKLVDDNAMKLGPIFTPLELDRYTVSLPGTQGGVNYYGGAFDPKRRLFVANINNLAQPMRMVRQADGSYVNQGPLAGTRRFWDADRRLPCGPTPWGQMVAVDIDTGKIAWRTTLGVTDAFPEALRETGRPGLGGTTLTTTGLAFVGATDDERFRAFETATGKEVWTTKLDAAAASTPIVYGGAGGHEFVAVVATGGSQNITRLDGDEVIAWSLPDGAR
ncbi:outer membrane protein assembly factor BamB family protein [Sphingomonas nostoxanthinifaciens]|uniref:outer membrane protein assembly factor BamB family protein n=1 Tax=Sphingomonas nostoxanthinifaciens TaxID=2872652 RepID=UPI001CC1FD07|nr:PQQ-binding-like beta-propeller repeat protein [Sphingomonas nostoxanthinifaciens]UAK24777.1 PQQ-binding-like beta-propeller repeat protein [Sphingomonas nostoxanthinifaciens]